MKYKILLVAGGQAEFHEIAPILRAWKHLPIKVLVQPVSIMTEICGIVFFIARH